jgi:hypothetical protein
MLMFGGCDKLSGPLLRRVPIPPIMASSCMRSVRRCFSDDTVSLDAHAGPVYIPWVSSVLYLVLWAVLVHLLTAFSAHLASSIAGHARRS